MKKLITTAGRLEGAIRNIGTHAAGVIISDKPLTRYLPLHRPTSQSDETPIKSITQFEMDVINDLGLLKSGLFRPGDALRSWPGPAT